MKTIIDGKEVTMSEEQVIQMPPLLEWEEVINPGRFKGKTVVVTGAGSGIGRAAASRIVREGGTVVGVDLNPEGLEELAGVLANDATEGVGEFIAVTADVTSNEDIARVYEAVGERKLDGLVNNAGIMDGFIPLHELQDDWYEKIMAVNVGSVVKMTRPALKKMMGQNDGAVVNVASLAGISGGAAGTAYTTSKHAMIGLTRNAALLYRKHNIRVNAVAPGGTITNVDGQFRSAYTGETLGPIMQGAGTRMASAELVAANIIYLLLDEAKNITGVTLATADGWNAI